MQVPTASKVLLTVLTEPENRGAQGIASSRRSQPAPSNATSDISSMGRQLSAPLKLPLHRPWSSTSLRYPKWMRKGVQGP